MSIQSFINTIITQIKYIINNPNVYVALVVGVAFGICAGGLVGAFAGGFIGYALQLYQTVLVFSFPVNLNVVVGGFIGLIIGAVIGGVIIGLTTTYKIHKKTYQRQILSHKEMPGTLSGVFGISIEIAAGMVLGAIIGSLKTPGIGTLLGAIVGATLMVISSSLEKKPRK